MTAGIFRPALRLALAGALGFFIFLSAPATALAASGLIDYQNSRFGFRASIPPGFVAGEAPANDDGRRFDSRDGRATITVWGQYSGVVAETMRDYRAWWRDQIAGEGGSVSYAAGKAGWFVLSGKRDGKIFYLRVEDGRNCFGEEITSHMLIEYPPSQRSRYDPLIGRLAAGLDTGGC